MGASSLVRVEPAHILRLKGIINQLRTVIERDSDGGGMARMAILLSTFADEIADELSEMPEMKVRLYMYQVGQIISWIGHGDNDMLPDGVREFAELIQPTVRNEPSDDGPSSYPELDTKTG